MEKRLTAMLLIMAILLSAIPMASAASIANGSTTVTITNQGETQFLYWTTGGGTRGDYWLYNTNDGITGPAYCIMWGLDAPSASKQLTITGKYTASPQTAGAFANGYPQRSAEQFVSINSGEPALIGLTSTEFAYATQIAVWATLGSLAVEGTTFSAGSMTVRSSTQSAQEARVLRAVQIILQNASSWTKTLSTGLYVRAEQDANGHIVNLAGGEGSLGKYARLENAAAKSNETGIKSETINGTEYYTREFTLASATSTYPNGYNINVWADGAPSGTIFADTSNNVLPTTTYNGSTVYQATADTNTPTELNSNGSEYAVTVKLCIPVSGDSDGGKITINCASLVTQYEIYEAYNPASSEQSFIIADPATTDINNFGLLLWGATEDPITEPDYPQETTTDETKFRLQKVDAQNGGTLIGATFKFEQIDGSFTTTGTTGAGGIVEFTSSDLPYGSYKVTETVAPEGYVLSTEVQTVNWDGSADVMLTFKDVRKPGLTLQKLDAENGKSLQGATFNIYKDGSLITTVTTNSAGLVTISGLSEGYYEAEETVAPSGYVLDSTRHGVHINPYDPATTSDPILTITNAAKPGLRIVKYDAQSMNPIPDTTFEVYRDTVLLGSYVRSSEEPLDFHARASCRQPTQKHAQKNADSRIHAQHI